ncbi:MAG: SIMPL domain-containing protein [Pedobacter sp.]|nr:MAG: SIMPL domain-containing protein [Pedobacter sp.]
MKSIDKNYTFPGIIAIAILISAFVIGSAYTYKYKDKTRIMVTGKAEKDFVSDLIVWRGDYSRISMDLKDSYANLKGDELSIRTYLKNKGLKENEVVFSAVNINKLYNPQYDNNGRLISNNFGGYSLNQTVKVESTNIDQVEKISREITELIQSGIELNSSAPSYYYTKMSELKIDLLAKASKDAKDRSLSIAENAGSSLGDLKYANMGVFQITGKNSNEDFSYGGAFNTSSKNKTASITIRTEYAVK